MTDQQIEGGSDEDSLFGSPPPSPNRGRSPSPSLALPSGSSSKNVGTIALPGSHTYSELRVNPPALSLSGFSHHELAQRPPALAQIQIPTQCAQAVLSRPSSQSSVGRKKKSGNKEKSSTPRPAPPPIPLPNPDEPPPANFLRNQQALLGVAGLVGGVHPANLSVNRNKRGSNSSNPIIVEDEEEVQPSIGVNTRPPPVSPAQLPPPSSDDIVASLIKQKNIFPVLESILKLIDPNQTSAQSQVNSGSRPTKRRKLSAVPAGASDWDVPYPFADGEGPESYRGTWEERRGRKLISELVRLIQEAAQKAATRNFVQGCTPTSNLSYYRSMPSTYSQTRPQSSSSFSSHDPSFDHLWSLQQSLAPGASTTFTKASQPFTPFDQLIASILPQASKQNPPSTTSIQGAPLPADVFDIPNENTSTLDIDQLAFENMMSVLNSPTINFNNAPNSTPSSNNPTPSASTTNSNVTNDDDDASCFDPLPASVESELESHNAQTPDFAIDPTLLALSTMANGLPPTPSLCQSPMLSTSSLADPLTPNWDVSFPEPQIHPGEQVDDPIFAATMLLHLASNSSASDMSPPFPTPSSVPLDIPSKNVAISTSMFPLLSRPMLNSLSPTTSSAYVVPAQSGTVTSRIGPETTATRGLGRAAKTVNKESILTKAKERRRQLLAEIERAKVELWETTIEQGVLAHLVKDCA